MAAVPSIGRASRVQPAAAPEADLTRALYEQYANQIFRYCQHQLGSREEAEDAVQSTFLNAFRGIKRGVVPELESAWLFSIAHNVCLSRRRSTWRRDRIESPADFEVVEELAPAPSRHADELIGLQDVLEQMPENQRRAILLREWQGLSYHEIAEELELSQSAVETLIFRARRSLAQGLEQPAELKKRRVRGADWANVLAGFKSLLLGSSVAVKVAATVAVVSATTVVATAPAQKHATHTKPAVPATNAQASVVAPPAVVHAALPAHPEHGLAHSPVAPLAVPTVASDATTAVDTSAAPPVVDTPSTSASASAPTKQESPPATPPGEAKKQDTPAASGPPGQTKKQDDTQGSTANGQSSNAPGQTKKQDDTIPGLTPPVTPPGQTKKQDGSSDSSSSGGQGNGQGNGQSSDAPGQSKKDAVDPSSAVPQPNPALNSPIAGSTGAVPVSVQDAANAARANNGNANNSGSGSGAGNSNNSGNGNGNSNAKGKGK